MLKKENDYEYYGNAGEYPKKPSMPILSRGANSRDIRLYTDAMEEYEKAIVEYNKQMNIWEIRDDELYREFKSDALEYVGLANHPKADKIFAYVWEYGPVSGYAELFGRIVEISKLFY